MIAFDRSGRIRWEKHLQETCFYGSPFLHGENLYHGTTAGSLWKIHASTGKTIWRKQGFGPVYSTPRMDGNRIVLGDNDGNLSIIGRESGHVIAQFRLDGDIQGIPLLQDGRYIVGGRDRSVHALRPVDLPEEEHVIH
jgi:outer membrane protein assembly factor BamB